MSRARPGHTQRRTGPNAITALTQLQQLGLPTGTCAADRAYTGCSPQNFQIPARRLGYRLALDYKAADRGVQGSWQGAVLIDGSLACPHIPAALANATHHANDQTVRARSEDLDEAVAQRGPYYLKLKENADARGTIRLQCPAGGPSPSVNCPRRERLRPHPPRVPRTPQSVVSLASARSRASHPAARPTVQLPETEWLSPPGKEALPPVCGASAISVPADAGGDLKTAKFRQDHHYLSPAWDRTYKPIRSHNEGINGRLKNGDLDIGNRKHRPARGQVAQTLLIAIMVTIGNLDILHTWLDQRTDQNASSPMTALGTAELPETTTETPETAGLSPPAGD